MVLLNNNVSELSLCCTVLTGRPTAWRQLQCHLFIFFSKESKTEIFLSGEIMFVFFVRKSAIKFHKVILHYRAICTSLEYFNVRLLYTSTYSEK